MNFSNNVNLTISGNNGGDGLVAARHLKLFQYNPVVFYPRKGKSELFSRLVKQLESYEIKIIDDLTNLDHALIVDSLFGFSKIIVELIFDKIIIYLIVDLISNHRFQTTCKTRVR